MRQVAVKKQKIIFLAMVFLYLVYIMVAFIVGEQQDARFKDEYQISQEVNTMIRQNRFSDAESNVNILLQRYPDNFILLWTKGICLSGEKQYKEAKEYYVKARTQRPFLLNDAMFLDQYANLLINLGEFKEARKYLLHAQKINLDPAFSKKLQNNLNEIENKMGESGDYHG